MWRDEAMVMVRASTFEIAVEDEKMIEARMRIRLNRSVRNTYIAMPRLLATVRGSYNTCVIALYNRIHGVATYLHPHLQHSRSNLQHTVSTDS